MIANTTQVHNIVQSLGLRVWSCWEEEARGNNTLVWRLGVDSEKALAKTVAALANAGFTNTVQVKDDAEFGLRAGRTLLKIKAAIV